MSISSGGSLPESSYNWSKTQQQREGHSCVPWAAEMPKVRPVWALGPWQLRVLDKEWRKASAAGRVWCKGGLMQGRGGSTGSKGVVWELLQPLAARQPEISLVRLKTSPYGSIQGSISNGKTNLGQFSNRVRTIPTDLPEIARGLGVTRALL